MKTVFAILLGLAGVLIAGLMMRGVAPRRATANTAASEPPRTAMPVNLNAPTQPVPIGEVVARVQADFEQRWKARQDKLQTKYMRGEIDADGLAAAGVEREIELDRELRRALGPEIYRAWDMQRVLSGLNIKRTALSENEQSLIYEWKRELSDGLREAQLEKFRGAIDQATLSVREQNAQNIADQKIHALLGDPRVSQLQNADDTAEELKRNLGGVPLDQNQLAALADAQREWDLARADLVTQQVNTQDRSIDAALLANDDLRRAAFDRIAGPGSLDQYLKFQDSRYIDLETHAKEWGLSAEDVDRVYATVSEGEEAIRQYTADAGSRDVSASTINAAAQQFVDENMEKLRLRYGDEIYRELKSDTLKPVIRVSEGPKPGTAALE